MRNPARKWLPGNAIFLIAVVFAAFLAGGRTGLAQEIDSPAGDRAAMSIADVQERFEKANALYGEGSYEEAFECYRGLYRDGVANAQVLANAGNAAYRAGKAGEAVLFYKRALRANPGYAMAHQNLQLIEPATNVLEGAGFWDLVARWFGSTHRGIWIALAELAFAGFLAVLYLLGRSEPRTDGRAQWGSRLTWTALLLVAAAGAAALHLTMSEGGGDAVVIQDKSITRSGPGEKFFQQLELPAGTAIELVHPPERGWVQFKLLDGRSGYIKTDVIERI